MKNEHHDTVERSLWASVVALEEAADIAEQLAPELGQEGIEEAGKQREQAAFLKTILARLPRRRDGIGSIALGQKWSGRKGSGPSKCRSNMRCTTEGKRRDQPSKKRLRLTSITEAKAGR